MLRKLLLVATLSAPFALPVGALAAEGGSSARPVKKIRKSTRKSHKGTKVESKSGSATTPTP